MKKLLTILLVTIFIMPGTLVPAQETGWEKVKDFLSSKPMILIYGAALGGHLAKLFLYDTLKNNKESSSLQKDGVDNDLRRGEKIHRAVTSRKNGLVDYLRDAAIRTNELITFVEYNGKFHLAKFASDRPQATAKALEEIKNDLEIYNKYLVSIGEPRFYFEYDRTKNIGDITFALPVVKEVTQVQQKPDDATIKIQYGETVYKAINTRKDGLIGYVIDACTRSKGLTFAEEKTKPCWWALKITREHSYPNKPIYSDESNKALIAMKEKLEAFNAYLCSIGEPEYYFQYIENYEYNKRLVEIRFDTRLKEKE